MDIEDPGQGDDDGETRCERNHDVGEDAVGPVQPVHDRLDDLQHRERRDGVANQRAEDAPSLQLPHKGTDIRPPRSGTPTPYTGRWLGATPAVELANLSRAAGGSSANRIRRRTPRRPRLRTAHRFARPAWLRMV